MIEEKQQSETPDWFRALLFIGGAILIGQLIGQLFEYLFGSEESQEKMPRVFISHSWENDKEYWTLVKKFNYYNFEYYNHSISEDKALDEETKTNIENGIRNKMKGCSKILVLAGDYANNFWIKREIEMAKEMKKEIIAIRPWGSKSIPTYLEKAADRIIGFNAKSIIENIKN